MGICRRDPSDRRIALLLMTCLFVAFFAGDQLGLLLVIGITGTYLHAHLPKHRNDDRDAANYRCAVAINQLQRFLRADDHVWPRVGEQRVDSSKPSGVIGPAGCATGQPITGNQYVANDFLDARLPVEIGRAEMDADYKVKLAVLRRSLDLLLYLIKRDEINIYDISARAHHEPVPRVPPGIQRTEHRAGRRIYRNGGQPHLLEEPKPAAARSTTSRRRRR